MKDELNNLLSSTTSGQLLSKIPQQKTPPSKQKVTPVSQAEQTKGFATLAKEKKANEEYTSRLKKIVQRANELVAADKSGGFNLFDKYLKQAQEEFAQAGQPYELQPKFPKSKEPQYSPRPVKNIGEGKIVKTFPVIVDGKQKTLTYEAPPEIAYIFRHGTVDEIQNITKQIIQEYAPETLQKDERYKFDTANAALDENFITTETTKNLKTMEDWVIRSTATGRGVQDALKFVQAQSEAYANRADNPFAKLAGMMVAGIAEDAANPLATFESKVGNIYDTSSTAEEWFGALGNAALYGLSVAPFAKAGVAGQQAMKAAEQAMARGLRIKAGLVAFGRTYGRETLLGGFAERKVTISQLRNVLKKQWYTDKEIDNIVSSQRKLYKMWLKVNKGDFNDFLLQQVRNETKSAEKALSKSDETVDAIGNVADATDMADTATKALQEPDIPGYNVPTEAIENVPMSRGVANLENFFNLAKQSGAIKTPLQEKAWRRVMMARAETWAKENNVGDPMAMFENMKVTIDDVMPDSALMQSFDELMKDVIEKGVGILEADKLGIHDYVLPDGTIIPQRGGGEFMKDPRNKGILQAGWSNIKVPTVVKKASTPYKMIGTLVDANLLNAPDTAKRWFDEIDAIAKSMNNSSAYKEQVFETIKTIDKNIGTDTNPKRIKDFQSLDELKDWLANTSQSNRASFYGGMLGAKIEKKLQGMNIPTAKDVVDKAMSEGYKSHAYGDVGGIVKLTDKVGYADEFGIEGHPNYKALVEGEPSALGINVPNYSLTDMFPDDIKKWIQVKQDRIDAFKSLSETQQEILRKVLSGEIEDPNVIRRKSYTDANYRDAVRKHYGIDEREIDKVIGDTKESIQHNFFREAKMAGGKSNPLSVLTPNEDVLSQYLRDIIDVNGTLFQKDMGGIARAWYNEANRQINFISGMSNFSSMVHETFHDWATMLKPEHQELLARAFGDMTTVEAKEAAARAFERYLRDGIAPEGLGLEKVFSSIKRWMTEVYNKVKGSPIEAKVDPDARRVFDEMLGSTSYGDYGITSARKQFIDADRKLLGSAKAVEAQAESFKQWMDEGNKMIDESGQDSRTWGATLAKEILNSPRPLSDKETGAMVSVMQVIKNNHKLLSDQLTGLTEATDNIKIKALNDQLSQLEKEFDELTLAVRISGTEKGRSLNAQKLTLNEDFDLISVLNRYKRRSFDGMVNDADKTKLTELTQKIKDLESRLKDVEDINIGTSGRAYIRTKTEIVAARKNIADAIAQSIKRDLGQTNMSLGMPSGATAKLLVDYALTFVEEGLGKIEDVVILAEKGLSDAGLVVSKGEIKQALQSWVSSKQFKNNDLVDYLAQLKTELRNTPEVAIRPLLGGEPTKQELAHFVLSFAEAGGGRLGDMVDKAIEHLNQYPQLVAGLATGSIREDMLDAMLEWGVPKQVTRQMDMREYQVDRAKKQVRAIIAQSEMSGLKRLGVEALATPRALKATADFSATLRQGLLLGAGNPVKATQAFVKAFVATANPAYANKLDKQIHMSKLAPVRKSAGLYISEGALSPEEVQFMQSLAHRLPGASKIIEASERHYTTFLNQLRVSVFDDMLSKYPDMSIAEQKALADFINVSTGRGRMTDSKLMNNVLFSPRFAVSRLQAPADLIGITKEGRAMWKSPAAKRQMLTSWGVFIGTATTLASLAWLKGADVQLDDVESPDWGKIRYGDTSVDVYGGFQQPIRLIARLAKMAKSPASEIKGTAYDILNQFLDYKVSPNVAIALNSIGKKDPVGQPFLVDKNGKTSPAIIAQDLGKAMGVPLGMAEIFSLWKGKGTNDFGKAVLTGGIILGLGTQTYDRNREKAERNKNPFEKKMGENPFTKMFEEDKGKKKKNPFSTDFVPSEYAF
jgi:hypothetical protein